MGAWGTRSHDNDDVHDLLIRAGRKGGQGFNDPGDLTNDQLERFLLQEYVEPLQLPEDEKRIQDALGTLQKLDELVHPMHFLGLVIWGMDRGWGFNRDILNVADEAGMRLIYDREEWPQYINLWKNPKIRHYCLLKEMCRIKQAIKEKDDV
jgi:hypothetical protein